MPLRVAIVVWARVPVPVYGSVEVVVGCLAHSLMRAGHTVTVMAPPGFDVAGARMVPICPRDEVSARLPDDIDIIHFHSDFPAETVRPALWTAHGTVDPTGLQSANICFLSASHASAHGRRTFVHNGLEPEDTLFQQRKSPRYLFLSRIHRPGKNVTRAVDLARKFNLELDIAGGHRWELLARSQVRREGVFWKTFHRRFRFHGMVTGAKKASLFASARAFLFPIRWEEPFGLVIIEALLAGTPVIGTPRGSMPELVQPGIGFICDSDEEFGMAFDAVERISPQHCRDYAVERFSADRMATDYARLYQRVLDGERLL
jgi:glycosyltransferase involved in cell wall biosynthesis